MKAKTKEAFVLVGFCLLGLGVGTLINVVLEIAVESISQPTKTIVYLGIGIIAVFVLFLLFRNGNFR